MITQEEIKRFMKSRPNLDESDVVKLEKRIDELVFIIDEYKGFIV
jgi:hypothetical protein